MHTVTKKKKWQQTYFKRNVCWAVWNTAAKSKVVSKIADQIYWMEISGVVLSDINHKIQNSLEMKGVEEKKLLHKVYLGEHAEN